jgi:hypothetical protein
LCELEVTGCILNLSLYPFNVLDINNIPSTRASGFIDCN